MVIVWFMNCMSTVYCSVISSNHATRPFFWKHWILTQALPFYFYPPPLASQSKQVPGSSFLRSYFVFPSRIQKSSDGAASAYGLYSSSPNLHPFQATVGSFQCFHFKSSWESRHHDGLSIFSFEQIFVTRTISSPPSLAFTPFFWSHKLTSLLSQGVASVLVSLFLGHLIQPNHPCWTSVVQQFQNSCTHYLLQHWRTRCRTSPWILIRTDTLLSCMVLNSL